MKFAYTIMYVEDVTVSIDFYEKAFGFARKFVTPENDYGELLTGETTISFASLELGENNIGGTMKKSKLGESSFAIELSFTTETIEKDFQKALDAGATLVKEVSTKPWGQQVGYVRDNNGFLIEICTPMKTE